MNTQYHGQNAHVNIGFGYEPTAEFVAYRIDGRLIFLPAAIAAEFDFMLSYRKLNVPLVNRDIVRMMRSLAPFALGFDGIEAFVAMLHRTERLGDVIEGEA